MISVCIPTYNGEKYIRHQLDSILSQMGVDDEVVISDDSSTDRTIEIIKEFRDSRIILIEGCSFRSPVLNLENTLKFAKGDYIFLADQDDVWLPGKVGITLERLLEYDVVVCNGFVVDQDEKVIQPSYFDWKGSRPGFFIHLAKNAYLGHSMAFNRKVLNSVLPFPRHIVMQDLWIGLIGKYVGWVYFIPKSLFCYRSLSENYSAAISKGDRELSDFGFWNKMELMFLVGKRVLFDKSRIDII